MSKLVLKTKLRRKLLTYFFTHPAQDFYVREIAFLINEDAGNSSRELKRLQEEGLFRSRIRGRVKFYSLNTGYPLFDELKKIISKTEGVEARLKGLVSKYKGISYAFIHGSYAKNKEKTTSDIDIVIVGSFALNEFTVDIRKLESELDREINFTSYTDAEFHKERNKQGGFLNAVLKDKKIVLKEASGVR